MREIAREIESVCWPAISDAGFEPRRIWSALARCRNRGASAQAIAGVDLALHDLAGKASGQPVWRLLGAAAGEPVKCNATLTAANPAPLRAMAERWAGGRLRHLQAQGRAGGGRGSGRDRPRGRRTGRPHPGRRQRAPGRSDVAVERLSAMAKHGLELAEQPVGGLEQMAEVRRRTRLRLAADEDVVTTRDARARVRAARLRARQRQAVQGGRDRRHARDRGRDPDLPLERARGAGRDRGRRARGAGPAAARDRLGARPRPGHRAAVL